MRPLKINKENLPLVLHAFAFGLLTAWGFEAFASEYGVASKYIATFAILGLFFSTFLIWRQSRKDRAINKYHRANR